MDLHMGHDVQSGLKILIASQEFLGVFNKDAIRIGSSVALTKNIFSTKPTEDGPKKFVKLWPY